MTSVTGHRGRRSAGAKAAKATRQAALASARDFESLISDAEALLKSTADAVGEQASEARTRLQKSLSQARDRIADDLEALSDHGQEAYAAADDFVHQRPWPVIGIAALAGVTAALLLGRR